MTTPTPQGASPLDARRKLFHAINNRLNTIGMGVTILEQQSDPDNQDVLAYIRTELEDLEQLLDELHGLPPE